MAYNSIHTRYGLTRTAQAEASGVPINLTHIAVGDGNGNPTVPDELQTQLVRERYRAAVNRVYPHPDEPGRFTAELVIPASVGGFVIREVGVIDADGGLYVVGNLPDTYKPNLAEGAYADTVVRVEFVVSNAAIITLQIDPNVAVASQQWVANVITSAYLLPGGTTGQILKKLSNADGDTVWADPDVADVVVDMREERQTLAASQTVVTFATLTTRGLAVYIDGHRINKGLAADEWVEDGTDPQTSIVLGSAYPAGTQLLGTQNEPTGSAPFPLVRSQNLADVPNKALARANLGVFSAMETRQMAPPGMVAYFARGSVHAGWLKANGAAVSRTAYADLFAVIGTVYGAGDGFNTFNLPDLRGEFLRGWDDARGVDAGRALGSWQADELREHSHTPVGGGSFLISQSPAGGTGLMGSYGGTPVNYYAGLAATGGAETRPRNIALLALIKY